MALKTTYQCKPNPNTIAQWLMFFLITLFACNAENIRPDFQDLNDLDPAASSNTKQGRSLDADEKKALIELQRKTENMLLFRLGDEEIIKKFPDAIIRETKNSKIKFFLAKNHETRRQIIVIRESDNLKNWIINFTFWKAKDFWTDIKLHKGFLLATREIFWDVVFHLEPEYPIEIYGHSLGGACSIILAMFLDEFGHPNLTVLSTGQPRVTDSKNAQPFAHIPYERFTTARDLVTHLPPQFLNYQHFGKWFMLRKDNGGWMNDSADPKEALELWNQWTANNPNEILDAEELEPKAAELWSVLKPKTRPASMKELFQSPSWKYLISMMDFGGEWENTPQPLKTGNKEDSSFLPISSVKNKPLGGLIDWIRYHNILLYRTKIQEMLDIFEETHSNN